MSEHRQLPVQLQLAPAESGLGFVLRAFRANGVAFDRGIQWLGLQRHRPMDRRDIRGIAWALNVDADLWGERMVIRDPGAKGWVRLAGQRFRRQVVPNRLYAKLCPQCVREHGILRLSWLLRATVGCPWHGYSLIWSCQRCGQGIGWDRPDVDICRCGYPFRPSATVHPCERAVQAWLCWLESVVSPKIRPAIAASSEPVGALPAAITHLSADGAFRVIEAMGIRATSDSSVRTAMSRCTAPLALGTVLARGLERLRAIEADPAVAPRFAPTTHQDALIQLASDFASREDHALAWWLLSAFQSAVDPGPTRAGRRPKGQLPLFIA